MIFLIIITFIAELIITAAVVTNILKFDRQVCLLNTETIVINNELSDIMSNLKEVTINIKDFINILKLNIIKRRNDFIINQLKSLVKTILILSFKPKYKKIYVGTKFGLKFANKMLKKINVSE